MSDELPIHPDAESPERPHAERSASQLKSLALCPGFKPDNTPKKEQHWVTQQGIRGHDALENADMGELQSSYEEQMVQACEDYCATLPPAAQELKEVKVNTIEGRWGYFDRLRFRKDSYIPLDRNDDDAVSYYDANVIAVATHADLIDYKFVKVKTPEDASLALQGKDYAVGIFREYPHLQYITVHFLAPRFNFVTYHTFSREDLPRIELEIFSVLTQARRTDKKRIPKKLLKPFYETCRFCARRATCPALVGIAREIHNRYLEEGATPLPEVPTNVHASQVNDPAVLGAIKLLATTMEGWAAAASHHCTTKAIEEGKIPEGYKIAYRKGRRKLTIPLTLLSIGPKFGLGVSDVIEASNVSVAKLEDAVMAKAPHGKKEKTKFAFLDALREADALARNEESAVLEKI